MIEIGKIKEGMTGRQVADLLYDNFLAVISGLGEYATEKWVTDKGYITKASLNGYATEKWVTGRGYITASAVAEGYATIASVNELLAAVNESLAERVEKNKFAEYFNSEMSKWFVKDEANRGIKPVNSYGLYSDTYVSAKGVSTGTGGSGGGSSYDRLDKWSDYTSDKAGWVLSALLGQDLNNRLSSLESGSALSLVTTGDGNAVTAIAKSGNQLTVTKGSTFQSLITSSNKLAYSLISGTPTSLPASDVAAWAKAASKPSYAFSEITNKPTTLSGYGITDAYTATTIDSKLGGYLPLSGGTITSASGDMFAINRTSGNPLIRFESNGNNLGYIGFTSGNAVIRLASSANYYNIIHSGNIGSYKSGSADYISNSTYYYNGNVLTNDISADYLFGATQTDNRMFPAIMRNHPLFGGSLADVLHYTGYCKWGATQIASEYNAINPRVAIRKYNQTRSDWGDWVEFITSANIGSQSVNYATSAGSATKLQTARTIWGQSFDGTGDVSGVLSDVNQISFDVNKSYGIFRGDWITSTMSRDDIGIYSPKIYLGGNVGIGTTTGIGHSTARLQIYNSENEWASIHYTDNSAVSSAHQLGYGMLITSKSNNSGKYLLNIIYNDGDLIGYGSSALSVFDNGNVGIGTTSPTEKLHVIGNIVATGSVTAKSSSDYRLKCEFDYNVDYQERLLSLGKVCDFKYTPHAQEREFAFADDKRHTSVIWQDARKANITGFCSVEEDGYGTINPLSSDLIFTMVGAIQQGIVKTERIEERVVRLEKENRGLKEKINLLEGGRYGC